MLDDIKKLMDCTALEVAANGDPLVIGACEASSRIHERLTGDQRDEFGSTVASILREYLHDRDAAARVAWSKIDHAVAGLGDIKKGDQED